MPLPEPEVIVVFLLIAFISTRSSDSLSFRLTSFSSTAALNDMITFQGDATVANGSIFLSHTPSSASPNNSVGRAKYSRQVLLWDSTTGALASFTSNFTFTMGNPFSNVSGDGLAFFITVPNSTIPDDSYGGHLGLFQDQGLITTPQTPMVVAVEFDTFRNPWDPQLTHMGIDVGSLVSNVTTPWKVKSLVGSVSVSAWVRYDAASRNLSARLLDENGASSSLSASVDLSSLLPASADIGFSAGTGSNFGIHAINSWSFESSLDGMSSGRSSGEPPNRGDSSRRRHFVMVIAVSVFSCISALLLVLVSWRVFWRRIIRRRCGDQRGLKEIDVAAVVREFRYKELVEATNGFSESREVGRGGFGVVYRGVLKSTGELVAVKKVSHNSKGGDESFVSEVNAISRLRHRNLVRLRGWCHEHGHSLLVYDFMPNQSLDRHIFGATSTLSWFHRYQAAIGLASALYYLHDACDQSVLHRDIKSNNVLLDSKLNAKLGDFGLARLVEHGLSSPTTNLAGTLGYLAPECFLTQRFTKKSDVYSFGIVALEIACGKRAVRPLVASTSSTAQSMSGGLSLAEWLRSLHEEGRLLEAADEKLGSEFDAREMECLMVVGLWCANFDHAQRPNISSALAVLNFEAPMPILLKHSPTAASSSSVSVPLSLSAVDDESSESDLGKVHVPLQAIPPLEGDGPQTKS